MRFTPTITLGLALLASLVVADDASDVPNVDISITKWGTAGCQGDHVGEEDMTIEDGKCQSMSKSFKSFKYGRSLMNKIQIWNDDWTNPTCKVIVYPFDACQGMGWTPGVAGASVDQCVNVPEQQQWMDIADSTTTPNDQPTFRQQLKMVNDKLGLEGFWMQSVGVVCVPGQVAAESFIVPDSAPYTEYELAPS